MLVYFGKVIAVGMDKSAAAFAFQVEMLVTSGVTVNVLIACSCFAVNGIAADKSLIDEAVKQRMRTVLTDLRGDGFARMLTAEAADGYPRLTAERRAAAGSRHAPSRWCRP